MAQGNFAATVKRNNEIAKANMLAVRNECAKRLIQAMQRPVGQGGNMPVDTGFLWSSGQITLDESLPTLVDRPSGPNKYTFDGSTISLTIANAKVDDTITFAYAAKYAICQNYGTIHMTGTKFRDLAVQQWPQIVKQVAAEAKAHGL
jgi:hypothetical protein